MRSDEEHSVSLCRGGTALVYREPQGNFLRPVDSTEDPPAPVALGTLMELSPDRASIAAIRRATTSEKLGLFTAACSASAALIELGNIDGDTPAWAWSPDGQHLSAWSESQASLRVFEPSAADPRAPVFAGEFASGAWLADGTLLLLDRGSDEDQWHLLDLNRGVPEPLPIASANEVTSCGRYVLIDSENPETGAKRTLVLEPGTNRKPEFLIAESTETLRERHCDSSGERIAYVRDTGSGQRIEIASLAEPGAAPAVVYTSSSPVEIYLEEFHWDERGLIAWIAASTGTRVLWLPLPGGVAAPAREFSAANPRLQPWP